MPQQLFPFSFSSDAVDKVIGAFPLSFVNVEGAIRNSFHIAFSPSSTWGGVIHEDHLLADSATKPAGHLPDDEPLMGHKLLQGRLDELTIAGNNKKLGTFLSSMKTAGRLKRQGIRLSPMVAASVSRIHASHLQEMFTPSDTIRKHASILTENMVEMARPVIHKAHVQDLWLYMSRIKIHKGHVETVMAHMNRLVRTALEEKGFLKEAGERAKYPFLVEHGLLDEGGEKRYRPFTIEQTVDTGVKIPHQAKVEQQVILANKAYMKSMLREDFIVSVLRPHSAVIEKLQVADKAKMQAVVESPIVADPQAKMALQMITLAGTDINKSARPAWDGVFDVKAEYLDAFTYLWPDIPIHDDRDDLIIVPNRDFDYRQNANQLMDENGVPYEPLSDVTTEDVQVPLIIDHPFPDWAEAGNEEVWVNLAVLKGGITELIRIWRGAKMKLAGMTLLEALNYLLKNYYESLDAFEGEARLEQYRVFRLARWFAERIVIHRCTVVLHRTYDSWMDKMYGEGSLNAPVTMEGFKIDETRGVLQTISPQANLKMTLTNYINGDLTISASVPSGSDGTSLIVRIDDQTRRILSTGETRRFTMPVAAGTHEFELRWGDSSGVGQAILSGFVLTGAVFSGATTTLEDPQELQGNVAINLLIADLMKYYQDHWDQYKTKGSAGIKQRKPWLHL